MMLALVRVRVRVRQEGGKFQLFPISIHKEKNEVRKKLISFEKNQSELEESIFLRIYSYIQFIQLLPLLASLVFSSF